MKLNIKSPVRFGTNILDLEVPEKLKLRIPSNLGYFDSAMGGKGFTPSQVTLFTGTPGAGKTTMLLTLADRLTKSGNVVIFVSGEESPYQIRMVAERLRLRNGFLFCSETHVPTLLKKCNKIRRENKDKNIFLVVDSLQTLDDGKYANGHINGRTAVRALSQITDYTKKHFINSILIGQVNKAGEMSGSNQIKHMVDSHLHLSVEMKDEELAGCRLLETMKNRFGGAGHAFFLKLSKTGFKEIARMTAV